MLYRPANVPPRRDSVNRGGGAPASSRRLSKTPSGRAVSGDDASKKRPEVAASSGEVGKVPVVPKPAPPGDGVVMSAAAAATTTTSAAAAPRTSRGSGFRSSTDSFKTSQLLPQAAEKSPRTMGELRLDAALEELYRGQHLLWKTRQRLDIVLSLTMRGKVLAIHPNLIEEVSEQALPPVFCDVRAITKAMAAVIKDEKKAALHKREIKGPLARAAKDALEVDVTNKVMVTFMLRRIALAESHDSVVLKLLHGDEIVLADLVLPAASPLIPELLISAHTGKPKRRSSLEDFNNATTEMGVERHEASDMRESSNKLRRNAMTILAETFAAVNGGKYKWDLLDRQGKWRLLFLRIAFRNQHKHMVQRLQSSKVFKDWERVYLARQKELADLAAKGDLPDSARGTADPDDDAFRIVV